MLKPSIVFLSFNEDVLGFIIYWFIRRKETVISKLSFLSKGIIIVFFILLLTACTSNENQSNKVKLENIISENSHGYYFDIYTADSRSEERNGKIKLDSFEDTMYFKVENAGQKRQLSVQIYIDYEQVPIKINDIEYDTYLIDAAGDYSKEFSFQLVKPIDIEYNHSMLAILTAGSDVYTSQVDYRSESYSIALNHILIFNQENPFIEAEYKYEKASVVMDDQYTGLFLNTDIVNNTRQMPEKELIVGRSEEFTLQYQVGGYEDCDEMAIIITVGLRQTEINNQKYLLCKSENGGLLYGNATIQAPEQEGLYEIMAWVVKNPFAIDKAEYRPLDSAYRFTLKVE